MIDDLGTRVEDVIVTGTKRAQRGAFDFFSNGYATYVSPVVDRAVNTAQAFGGGIRDLYVSSPSISRTSLPTGHVDANGIFYPGTGTMPGNDYNPIAHPWTTAGMAVGVGAAPYAAIAAGPYVIPAITTVSIGQMGLDDGPIPFIPAGLGALRLTANGARVATSTQVLTGRAPGVRLMGEQAGIEALYQARYQSLYDEASVLIPRRIDEGLLSVPSGLPRGFYEANRMDAYAALGLSDFAKTMGHGDDLVRINRGLAIPNGGIRRPDVLFPPTGNILEGTISAKSIMTPQIRDYYIGTPGSVTVVSPTNLGGHYLIPRPGDPQ